VRATPGARGPRRWLWAVGLSPHLAVQTRSGDDVAAWRWQTFWGSRMPNIPGFRHAHFAADPATNPTAAFSLWEQRPDAATMEPLMRGFRTQVADLSGSWPVIEEYEILADF
jgi:hypothetical protein